MKISNNNNNNKNTKSVFVFFEILEMANSLYLKTLIKNIKKKKNKLI